MELQSHTSTTAINKITRDRNIGYRLLDTFGKPADYMKTNKSVTNGSNKSITKGSIF
jgi:hypothetical protein